MISPPQYIDDRAKEEFRKIVGLLGTRVQPTDVYIIAEFAQAVSDVQTLMDIIKVEGETITNPDSGAKKMNPNVAALMARRQYLYSLTKELGLTPKQRKEKPVKGSKSLNDLV